MRTARLAPLALATLIACSARSLQTSDGTDGGSTDDPIGSTSGTATNPTTGSTGSTGEPPSDTTTTTTTTGTPGTTTGADSSSSASTTMPPPDGPPSTCGPPCPATWEHFGDLDVDSFTEDLSCLTRVHGRLTTWEDADLAVVASLANLRQVDGQLFISHGTHTDLAPFACLEHVGEIFLIAAQLTDLSLPKLVHASTIHLANVASTGLPKLAPGFTGLERLELFSAAKLVDLSEAANWGAAAASFTLLIDGDAAFTDLNSLAPLLVGNTYLWAQIIDHPQLTSLAGLEAVTEGNFYVAKLPALASLDALKNLKTASITLIDLPLIQDLSGLAGLEIAHDLSIGDCVNFGTGGMDGLTSLAGLDNLKTVLRLALANNDQLASLDGAPKLTSVSEALNAVNNPALMQKAYDKFLAQLNPAPQEDCYGDWDQCPCFEILPW